MQRRILIFGGSFNPPTLAHEAMMRACLELPHFAEVWVMPSGDRLDKRMATSDAHRLAMLQAIKQHDFHDDARLQISDFELKLPRPTQTWRTIHVLRERYPDTEFWFAFGGDAYRSLPGWPRAGTYMPELNVVVFTEWPTKKLTGGQLLRLGLPASVQDLSSTQARRLLAAGADTSHCLSVPVREYIAAHSLYSR